MEYLIGQVKAGAQMLQIFESNAEYLGPDLFQMFCIPYLSQICDRVKAGLGNDAVPMTIFAKGGGQHSLESLRSVLSCCLFDRYEFYNGVKLKWTKLDICWIYFIFRATSYDVVSIDWTMNPLDARKILGEQRKPPNVETPVVINTDGKAPRVLQVTQKVELLRKIIF